MGSLVPKTYLKWCEPEEYRRSVNKMSKKFSRRENLLLALLLVSYLLFLLLMGIIKPPKNPRPLWFYSLPVVSFVGIYVISLRGAKLPYTVKIREDDIKAEGGNGVRLYKYKKILNYSIESKDVDGKMFMALFIIPVRGKKQSFGIDPAISLDDLKRILSEKWGQQRDPERILKDKEFKS
jgi:hypothetical protein